MQFLFQCLRRTRLLAVLLLVACGGGGSGGGNSTPLPQPDSYSWTGNTRLTVFASNGLLANDPPGSVITSADNSSSQGGSVSVNTSTGAFVYDPPLGLQNGSDTYTYTVAGAPPVTVTIVLAERIWFVRNNDPGANQGNDRAPFRTLAQAEAAADIDDTIFVFAGNLTDSGQDVGITLQSGQRLIGEGVGLKVNGFPLVDPVPNAVISNRALGVAAGNTPVVRLADDNEVAGFTIQAIFNDGILADGGGGYSLHDNRVNVAAGGREGLRLLKPSGACRILRNIVNGAQRNGIQIANNQDLDGNPAPPTPVTGTVAIGGNTISATVANGIDIHLDGTGTDVALHLLTNTVSASGATGIALQGLGAAKLMTVLSGNGVANSADTAIDLSGDGTTLLDLFVANSTLTLSGAGVDLRAATAAASSANACLEMINNGNGNLNATFAAGNNGNGNFSLFEAGNDTLAVRTGTITDVPVGSCNIALNGSLLFEVNCGRCHVGNGMGYGNVGPNVTNATAAMINFQLVNNPTMSVIKLTSQEVEAIAAALLLP